MLRCFKVTQGTVKLKVSLLLLGGLVLEIRYKV